MLFLIVLVLLFSYPVGYHVLDKGQTVVDPLQAANSHPSGVISYVINLDRSPERLQYVLPSIVTLGYPLERISAVDGKKLSETEVNNSVNFAAYERYLNNYPRLGTIGCSLSHIHTWQQFLNSNFEYAVVFEDDVKFDPATLRPIIDLLIKNNKYWDISTFEVAHNGMPLTIKQLSDPYKLVVYLTEISHTGAYIINRNAAQKLLEKALPIKMPIDHYFTRTWEMGLKFTGVEPRLVHQQYGDSVINQTDVSGHATTYEVIVSGFYKSIFKLQSYVIRFLYNLKLYFELKYGL